MNTTLCGWTFIIRFSGHTLFGTRVYVSSTTISFGFLTPITPQAFASGISKITYAMATKGTNKASKPSVSFDRGGV
jgi:hypothetical protein